MALLITADEARKLIPSLASGVDDDVLEVLIHRADAMLAAHCGYPPATAGAAPSMESVEYVLEHTWCDQGPSEPTRFRDLFPSVMPVTEIDEIREDLKKDFGTDTVIDSAHYAIVKQGRLIRLTSASGRVWAEGDGVIRVSFTAGFATIPQGLKNIVAMTVSHLYGIISRQGKVTVTTREATTAYREESLPPLVESLVGQFMLPSAMGF